jgi:hypothetical protein
MSSGSNATEMEIVFQVYLQRTAFEQQKAKRKGGKWTAMEVGLCENPRISHTSVCMHLSIFSPQFCKRLHITKSLHEDFAGYVDFEEAISVVVS